MTSQEELNSVIRHNLFAKRSGGLRSAADWVIYYLSSALEFSSTSKSTAFFSINFSACASMNLILEALQRSIAIRRNEFTTIRQCFGRLNNQLLRHLKNRFFKLQKKNGLSGRMNRLRVQNGCPESCQCFLCVWKTISPPKRYCP